MKPKHYLVHVVRNHRKKASSGDAVKEEIRKTLSKDHFTAALKRRLVERQKRDTLISELRALELELVRLHTAEHERVKALRARIESLKKKG
jgi:hypothetical protein